jgi:hypothetical protein
MSTPAPAVQTATATVLKFQPKVIKQVSVNLLKLRPGVQLWALFTAPMAVSKPLKNQSAEDKAKEPPTLLPIVNLESGEVQNIIVGSVLKDLLNDEYPNGSYVGRAFGIAVKEQKDAKAGGGRRYNNYDVVEIEVPEAQKALAASLVAAKKAK